MAEISLMDGAKLVWVVQMPSTVAHAWRDLMRQACVQRAWDFAIHERGDPAPTTRPGRSLLVVAWLDQTHGLEVTQWAVQLSSPADVAALLKSEGSLSDHDALYEASLRLATAWDLVQRGALVNWCDDAEMEIPGLGLVQGPSSSSPSGLAADHSLAMFERNSMAGAQATHWTPDIFRYPDARPTAGPVGSLPLVGRRRLLLNGPNIFLPAGTWAFSVEISIDPPGATELLVEWGHGYDVVSLTASVQMAGRYEITLEKQWSGVQPADFRISLMIPALEGEFAFHGGLLVRKPD